MGAGYRSVEGWPSVFYNPATKMLLSLYVDDFLLSGPSSNRPAAVAKLRTLFKLGEENKLSKYLGCNYNISRKGDICHLSLDMQDFLASSVDLYTDSVNKLMEKARNAKGFREADYKKLLKLSSVDTPSIALDLDNELSTDEVSRPGLLADIAASITMKLMFAARCARPDLLRTISHLSTRLTKWTRRNDLELRRLTSYVSSSLAFRVECQVGDRFEDLSLACYVDSDYAGDYVNDKSTSGCWTALVGPKTDCMISFASNRQTAVARSSTEAEVAAGDRAVRRELIPISDLIDVVRGSSPAALLPPPAFHKNTTHNKAGVVSPLDLKTVASKVAAAVPLHLFEDNQACRLILDGSISKELRHVARTHRISISFLQDVIRHCAVNVHYIPSADNIADVFTKLFTDAGKWHNALCLMGMSFTLPRSGLSSSSPS